MAGNLRIHACIVKRAAVIVAIIVPARAQLSADEP
jgi:hypothetical protein